MMERDEVTVSVNKATRYSWMDEAAMVFVFVCCSDNN